MGLFGQRQQYNIGCFLPEEQRRLEKLYKSDVSPQLRGSEFDAKNTSRLAVKTLEKAASKEPAEFLWRYVLGDHYGLLGRLSDAVRSCRRAVKLHSDDPRAVYGLATSYRMLMQAAYAEPQYRDRVALLKEMSTRMPMAMMGPEFDPDNAAKELQNLGITWEKAAKRSVKHFNKALALGVSRSERKHIEQTIEYIHFECLQHGVRL